MPNVSESDLAGLIAIKDLYTQSMANPDAREHVMKATKIVRPQAVNEVDTAERYLKPVKDELGQTKGELAALRKQWMDDKAERETADRNRQFETAWDAQKQKLRSAGYMNGAIEAIEKLALAEGIPNLEHAAAVYDKTTPPASISAPRYGSLALMDGTAGEGQDDYMAKLFKGGGNAPGETRKQVLSAIQEVRQGRAA